MARCKVIGIFGGVGSGKSLVTKYLEHNYHAYVIEADKIAHSLYRKGQPGYKAIKRICGKSIFNSENELDRNKLAEYLIIYPETLPKVNDTIHPMVYKKCIELIDDYKSKHNKGLVIYEAALLPKKELDFLDEKWFVKSDLSIRKERLKSDRCYNDARIEMILSKQPDDDVYTRFADKVITNNGTIKELEEQINATL